MELFYRQEKIKADNFVLSGTEFKREFSFSSTEIKVSFIIPLDKIKGIDFFTIKYESIKDKGIIDDVISMKKKHMDLDNMQIVTTDNSIKYARLTYRGIATKVIKSMLYDNDYDLQDRILTTVPTTETIEFNGINRSNFF